MKKTCYQRHNGLLTALFLLISISIACNTKHNEKATPKDGSFPLVENTLIGTNWRTEGSLNLSDNVDNYTFTQIDTTERYPYGYFIHFVDSTHFVNYYAAKCGNDCFTTVFGQYQLRTNNKVMFSVDSIGYSGECEKATEYGVGKEILFDIQQTDKAIFISK